MNKKIVTLILVILISFCFIGIVVADNVAHDDGNGTDTDTNDKNDTIDDDDDDADKNNTDDKDKTSDKDKTDDKSKKHYILAKGKGNDIKFSDGFRGYILDYSKSPASSGDEFKHVSTSKAHNSNALKLAIIECYKQDSTDKIGKIIADFVKTGSSSSKVGEAVAASHEKVGDHAVVKIDDDTEAVFDFEVLKSVSGNESNYFAYKVSFRSVDDADELIPVNQTNNMTNVTNATNATNTTNVTNVTNATNITNITQPFDNQTNATFLDDLYDYLLLLANALYDAWKPIFDTIINYFMMIINALEELARMFEDFMAEIQSLLDALEELLAMLASLWKGLDGLLKLIGILLTALGQLLNLIGSVLDFIAGLISSIISLIQWLLGLLSGLIDFILGLINQILGWLFGLIDQILGWLFDLLNQIASLLQAIFDFLKSAGSFLINVIENGVVIIGAFVVITIGAFIYNRIR